MTAMFLASAKYLMRCLILETALCAKCCDYSKPTYKEDDDAKGSS